MIRKIMLFLGVIIILNNVCSAATTNLTVSADPGNKTLGIEPSVYGFLTVRSDTIITPQNEPLPKIWVKTADNKTLKYKVIWIYRNYIGQDKMQWEFRIEGLEPNKEYRIYGKTSVSPSVFRTV
jgi:hypothetical protein